MKRVLHVGKFYPPVAGGMERVVETLCRASAGLVESRVLVMNTGRNTVEEDVGGIHVTRVGMIGSAGSVSIAPAFGSRLRSTPADLIVLHEPNPWALLCYATMRPSAPLVIWYHSDVVRHPVQYGLFYAPLARTAYRRAERFIVSSPALGEHAAALALYRSHPVIPFGIDPRSGSRRRHPRSRRADRRETGPFVPLRDGTWHTKGSTCSCGQGTKTTAVIAGTVPSARSGKRSRRRSRSAPRCVFQVT